MKHSSALMLSAPSSLKNTIDLGWASRLTILKDNGASSTGEFDRNIKRAREINNALSMRIHLCFNFKGQRDFIQTGLVRSVLWVIAQ
jgi:hypothetical protein